MAVEFSTINIPKSQQTQMKNQHCSKAHLVRIMTKEEAMQPMNVQFDEIFYLLKRLERGNIFSEN